jgi:hypothetical protein
MIWTGVGITDKTDKYKFYCGLEERFYIPVCQKEFMVDYRTTISWKVMPIIGLSIWNHAGDSEIRPYYGIDSKYFRLLLENRIFLDDKMVNRLRARLQYRLKLKDWFSLFASEELFWTKRFDNNRLNIGMEFKIKKTELDLGYMSYYKDRNQNVLILKLNHNI